MLKSFFDGEFIEFFSILPYSRCKVIRPDIMAREKFSPVSVIVYLVPYYTGEAVNISKYAISRDYHIYIKELNERLGAFLKKRFTENSFKGYGDSSPIDERRAAISLGLGIRGENGLLINEKYGSYVFIGEMITDISTELLGNAEIRDEISCKKCGRCKNACPTGRLKSKENPCLSDITQRKGALTEEEINLMRKCGTVWGCDLCQSVCPYNENAEFTPIEFFRQDRIAYLTDETLSSMSEADFRCRAYSWRGRKTVERNLGYIKKG